jgi:uncharacterized protein
VNLPRLIIIAVAVWLAIHTLRRIIQHLTPPKTAAGGAAKNMVRCAQCGLHLPEAEAISVQGLHYCSEEHRRQHAGTA